MSYAKQMRLRAPAWMHPIVAGATMAMCVMLGQTSASAQSFEASTVSVQDFTGSVELVSRPVDGADKTIRVEIRQGNSFQPVEVDLDGDVVVVEGARWKEDNDRNCCDGKINREFYPRKGRKLSTGEPVDEDLFAEYPTLIITVPVRSNVTFVDARIKLDMETIDGKLDLHGCYVYGETGDVDEAVIGLVSGSRLVMGDIDAGIEIDLSGDADLKLGTVSIADVDIAGPGDVIFDRVDGMLDISIAGSGLVRSDWVEGPMTLRVAGSGGAAIKDGRVDRLKAIVDGSGGLLFEGLVVNPDLRLYGSSEVRLARIQGRIVHEGSGELYVGGELRKRP